MTYNRTQKLFNYIIISKEKYGQIMTSSNVIDAEYHRNN